MNITIETTVKAPLAEVWRAWTTPGDVMKWNAASSDWHTPAAENDLRVGGTFIYRMAARDGSMAFDFTGTYTRVVEHETIAFTLEDGRPVTVEFVQGEDGVMVRETFAAEDEHSGEQQREGWQAILDNFARHVESGK